MTGKKQVYKLFISIGIFLLMTDFACACELPSDTIIMQNIKTELQKDTLSGKVSMSEKKTAVPIHSPKKAALFSAILPGLGQAYNKKYWKIPLVYAGFGTLGYFIRWNNKKYTTYKDAYLDLTDKDPDTKSYLNLKYIEFYDLNNLGDIAKLKNNLTSSQDYFRRNRDLLVIVTVAFYGLNIIDASVDGHFFNFDISDDLTMKVRPSMLQQKNQNIFCLNCTFNF